MKPPIFLLASDGELMAFEAAADLEHWVESIDVEGGEYVRAFDSEGRLLALEVARPTVRHKFLGMESIELTLVRLVEKATEPDHSSDLMAVLAAALARVGRPVQPEDASLEKLVEKARRTFRVP